MWDIFHLHWWWSPDRRRTSASITERETVAEHRLPLDAGSPFLSVSKCALRSWLIDRKIPFGCINVLICFVPLCRWLIEHKNYWASSLCGKVSTSLQGVTCLMIAWDNNKNVASQFRAFLLGRTQHTNVSLSHEAGLLSWLIPSGPWKFTVTKWFTRYAWHDKGLQVSPALFISRSWRVLC